VKILLVDDEVDIRKVAKLSLEAVGGHSVVLADGAVEALLLAATERPDLILIDVMMPGMDGPTAVKELRKDPTLANIPVIFMTARVQRTDTEHYRSLGAVGVIGKPFDPMTLPDEIKRLLPTS
jgi:CheY-like chemotaxis protein